jgi:hypothetical protein
MTQFDPADRTSAGESVNVSADRDATARHDREEIKVEIAETRVELSARASCDVAATGFYSPRSNRRHRAGRSGSSAGPIPETGSSGVGSGSGAWKALSCSSRCWS